MIKKLLPYVKNKYIITLLAFFVWMLFFDKNDLISQFSQKNKLNRMKADKDYFTEEIEKSNQMMEELMTNPKTLERFAREKYLMKKDNEEVFVILTE